jgi:hypothetical protein
LEKITNTLPFLKHISTHQNPVQYQQTSTPEAYHHEAKSPAVSSHELSTFWGHEAVFVDIVYLSHGHGAEGHEFSYRIVNTHWPKYHSFRVRHICEHSRVWWNNTSRTATDMKNQIHDCTKIVVIIENKLVFDRIPPKYLTCFHPIQSLTIILIFPVFISNILHNILVDVTQVNLSIYSFFILQTTYYSF